MGHGMRGENWTRALGKVTRHMGQSVGGTALGAGGATVGATAAAADCVDCGQLLLCGEQFLGVDHRVEDGHSLLVQVLQHSLVAGRHDARHLLVGGRRQIELSILPEHLLLLLHVHVVHVHALDGGARRANVLALLPKSAAADDAQDDDRDEWNGERDPHNDRYLI